MTTAVEALPTATPSLWQFLALPDDELETADVVAMNLAVARGIPSLQDLDVARYCRIVDAWTQQFTRYLPGAERQFRSTPGKWRNDIRLFRVGMLQGYLGHEIGVRYIEEHKKASSVRYTNPNVLFLNGLIDTLQGSCGNMAVLHVAMARRMGWPVALACAKSHFLSRFDDGEVVHNIEATTNHPGSFCSEFDDFYVKKFDLPRRAIECGSDLRKLTAREMMAMFISMRGRHFMDTDRHDLSDVEFSLARALFPNHRRTYIMSMTTMIYRGERLFNDGEIGHPRSLFGELRAGFAEDVHRTPRRQPTTQVFPPPPQRRNSRTYYMKMPSFYLTANLFQKGKKT